MSDDDRIPSGVLRKRKGWQGDEMELDHQREKLREGSRNDSVVAVDLKQFHNHKVGEGYQAKHVVRQKSGVTSSRVEIVDMSSKNREFKTKTEKKRDEKLSTYLRSNAMREFRRQLEEILNSS
jgi:hypothetical protein